MATLNILNKEFIFDSYESGNNYFISNNLIEELKYLVTEETEIEILENILEFSMKNLHDENTLYLFCLYYNQFKVKSNKIVEHSKIFTTLGFTRFGNYLIENNWE